MSTLARMFALCAAAGAPALSQATILTFSESGASQALLADYGDRVAGSPQNGATYGMGQGWTPQIELDFATGHGGPPTIWTSGYGFLIGALGHGQFDVPFTLTFAPDPGQRVRLIGFDIATWYANYDTDLRIWDDNGSRAQPNLFSHSQRLLFPTVYRFSPDVLGTGALHLYVSNLGATGLDNIHFSQVPVPEPQAYALLVLGLAVVGAKAARPYRSHDGA